MEHSIKCERNDGHLHFYHKREEDMNQDDVILFAERLPLLKTAGKKSSLKSCESPMDAETRVLARCHSRAAKWEPMLIALLRSEEDGQSPTEEKDGRALFFARLPTAIVAACGLRDLKRMQHFYPSVHPEETQTLSSGLMDTLRGIINGEGFKVVDPVLRAAMLNNLKDPLGVGLVDFGLIVFLPHVPWVDDGEDRWKASVKAGFDECVEKCTDSVGTASARIAEMEIFDCQFPHPTDDATYQEEWRFAQMAGEYWDLCKQIIFIEEGALVGFPPDPLTELLGAIAKP